MMKSWQVLAARQKSSRDPSLKQSTRPVRLSSVGASIIVDLHVLVTKVYACTVLPGPGKKSKNVILQTNTDPE